MGWKKGAGGAFKEKNPLWPSEALVDYIHTLSVKKEKLNKIN
jgi:hypothetical protein